MSVAIADRELEAVRDRGFAVAYRMLGTVSEAEDVVQDALLRMARTDEPIEQPAAWITTVATRLAIDVLRSARVQRETYIGPWLPEPLVEDAHTAPEARAELADSVSQAFLVLLERLTPVERAAFVLREVFGYDYPELAAVLNRTEVSCRQLVTRAKKHVEAEAPRFDTDPERRDRLFDSFVAAAEDGDLEELEQLLAEDAVFYSDGGGRISAARRPLYGAARIARVFASITRKSRQAGPFEDRRVRVNGQPGRIRRTSDRGIWDLVSVDVVDGRIQTVRVTRNPDKLTHL
jgi:RNA polymerase sigma-70 factor (ECF subfamily)